MNTANGLTRREVLAMGVAVDLPATWGVAAETKLAPPASQRSRTPRNTIFVASDVMSAGVPSLAEPFSRVVRGKGTWFHQLA